MGLLDDAIREHLDLKWRRGADPTEIERAEREALGPVRRHPEGADELVPDSGAPLAYDHEEEAAWPDEPESAIAYEPVEAPFASESPVGYERAEAPPEPASAIEHERSSEPEPAIEAQRPEPLGEIDDWHREVREPPTEERPSRDPEAEAPSRPRSSVPPHRADPVGPETAEYNVEFEEEPAILEETPDFLQDAPEHDRLWFEQKPPKDFDFEG